MSAGCLQTLLRHYEADIDIMHKQQKVAVEKEELIQGNDRQNGYVKNRSLHTKQKYHNHVLSNSFSNSI